MNFTILAIHGRYAGALEFERVHSFIPSNVLFEAIDLPGFGSLKDIKRNARVRDYSNYLQSIIQNLPKPIVLLGSDIGCCLALEYCQYHSDNIIALLLHSFPADAFQRNFFEEFIKPLNPYDGKISFGEVLGDYDKRFNDSYKISKNEGAKINKLFDHAWLTSLNKIEGPNATFLSGMYDKPFSPKQEECLNKILPLYSTISIPHWRNFPMIEQPADFAHEILSLGAQLLQIAG